MIGRLDTHIEDWSGEAWVASETPEASHTCFSSYRESFQDCGQAIKHIVKVAGRWWAWNEEYATPVHFCPFCGMELN